MKSTKGRRWPVGRTAIWSAIACSTGAVFGPGLLGLTTITPVVAIVMMCSFLATMLSAVTAVVQRHGLNTAACWCLLLAAVALLATVFQRTALLAPLFARIPIHSIVLVLACYGAVLVTAIAALWEAEWDPGPLTRGS